MEDHAMPRLATLTTEEKQFLDERIRKAETAEDWAEVARVEAEMLNERPDESATAMTAEPDYAVRGRE
jgi:hypothetical protein